MLVGKRPWDTVERKKLLRRLHPQNNGCLGGRVHAHSASTAKENRGEEIELSQDRAVGEAGKVMKKSANCKTSQRGQPRPLRAKGQED